MGKDEQKELVGRKAAELVENGMVVGIGTGSTVFYFIDELAKKGVEITGVVTSNQSGEQCKELGIPVVPVDSVEKIDIAVDGADEVDKDLNLIKGGGGALTREKVVDYKADKFVVVVDSAKMVEILGDFPLAVEVGQEAWEETRKRIEEKTGAKAVLRGGETPFVTDNNGYILDCKFTAILKPAVLEDLINNIQGVVQNGIFRKEKVSEVWVGYDDRVEKIVK